MPRHFLDACKITARFRDMQNIFCYFVCGNVSRIKNLDIVNDCAVHIVLVVLQA